MVNFQSPVNHFHCNFCHGTKFQTHLPSVKLMRTTVLEICEPHTDRKTEISHMFTNEDTSPSCFRPCILTPMNSYVSPARVAGGTEIFLKDPRQPHTTGWHVIAQTRIGVLSSILLDTMTRLESLSIKSGHPVRHMQSAAEGTSARFSPEEEETSHRGQIFSFCLNSIKSAICSCRGKRVNTGWLYPMLTPNYVCICG